MLYKPNLIPNSLLIIDNFHNTYSQKLWRLREYFIWKEFEDLSMCDAIAAQEWQKLSSELNKLRRCDFAMERVLSHNNIVYGLWYASDQVKMINYDYAACNPRIFDIATLANTTSESIEDYLLKYLNGRADYFLFLKYFRIFRKLSAVLYALRYYKLNNKEEGNYWIEYYYNLCFVF